MAEGSWKRQRGSPIGHTPMQVSEKPGIERSLPPKLLQFQCKK